MLVAVPLVLVALDGRAPTGPGSAAVVAAILFAGSAPLLAVISRRDGDRTLYGFLLVALAAKLAGGFARYYLTTAAYGGLADAARYDSAGREWVAELQAGRPVLVVDSVANFGAGTKALSTITGLVYAGAGRNIQTGFIVFSWLGFWGLVMAYRAFRVGFPEGDHRRYRLLLFFLPSLVFWPSSIGKDAWMQLTLGAVFLGVAWVTRPSPRWTGLFWLVAGLGGAALLRPHIALAALAPLAVALGVRLRRTDGDAPHRAGVVRIAGMAILGLASILLLNRLGTVFGNEGDPTAGSVTGVLDTASNITAQGGSEFEATSVSSITDLPMATVSVLFRPFLWEATSAVKAIAGLETRPAAGPHHRQLEAPADVAHLPAPEPLRRLRRRVRPGVDRRVLPRGQRGHPGPTAHPVPARRSWCCCACPRPAATRTGRQRRRVDRFSGNSRYRWPSRDIDEPSPHR